MRVRKGAEAGKHGTVIADFIDGGTERRRVHVQFVVPAESPRSSVHDGDAAYVLAYAPAELDVLR